MFSGGTHGFTWNTYSKCMYLFKNMCTQEWHTRGFTVGTPGFTDTGSVPKWGVWATFLCGHLCAPLASRSVLCYIVPIHANSQIYGANTMTPITKILTEQWAGQAYIPFVAAAKLFSIAEQTARHQVSEGRFPLPTHRIAGRRVVATEDIVALEQSLRSGTKQ
jgi:hypothetical protein